MEGFELLKPSLLRIYAPDFTVSQTGKRVILWEVLYTKSVLIIDKINLKISFKLV